METNIAPPIPCRLPDRIKEVRFVDRSCDRFVSLPMLTVLCEGLLAKYSVKDPEKRETGTVVVIVSPMWDTMVRLQERINRNLPSDVCGIKSINIVPRDFEPEFNMRIEYYKVSKLQMAK